jgi:rubredoxin
MPSYVCAECGYLFDEAREGVPFATLADSWVCPVCGAPKSCYAARDAAPAAAAVSGESDGFPEKTMDDLETWMADIRRIAEEGRTIEEAMRTRLATPSWDDILFKGGQLARRPLLQGDPVNVRTVIGPKAAKPLIIGFLKRICGTILASADFRVGEIAPA